MITPDRFTAWMMAISAVIAPLWYRWDTARRDAEAEKTRREISKKHSEEIGFVQNTLNGGVALLKLQILKQAEQIVELTNDPESLKLAVEKLKIAQANYDNHVKAWEVAINGSSQL